MSPIGGSGADPFSRVVRGTFGEFRTPAGRLHYLSTKARLGRKRSGDTERILTSYLSPVREVLEVKKLTFGQLLQRDLDDNRVVSELLPYLLRSRPTPTFFPPITAVVLPATADDAIPTPSEEEAVTDSEENHWGARQFGDFFKVERLLATTVADVGYHWSGLARFKWQDALTNLVVLDGQHRAMALLAIQRHFLGWGKNEYRVFYEAPVKELLEAAVSGGWASDLEEIEVPVTVCWFPEAVDEPGLPLESARQLFVDVNENARQPSLSRLLLLSDSELIALFVRRMLDKVKVGEASIPIHAVEYDHPARNPQRPTRWSVVTNLGCIQHMVRLCVFGPGKLIAQMDENVPGGTGATTAAQDGFMRTQLDLSSVYPQEIAEGDRVFQRDQLGNESFPSRGAGEPLLERFWDSWGRALTALLGTLGPYAAHIRALDRLGRKWEVGPAEDALAKDAIFEGAGLYWTLIELPGHGAARLLTRREVEFRKLRAEEYLGSDADVGEVDRLYGTLITIACQLGVALAAASIVRRRGLAPSEVEETVKHLASAWNRALESDGQGGDRKRFFSPGEGSDRRINRIRMMNVRAAGYFRYFWLELLVSAEAREVLDAVTADVATDLASEARLAYFRYRETIQRSALKDDPTVPNEEINQLAFNKEAANLSRALRAWFELSEESFRSWLGKAAGVKPDEVDLGVATDEVPDVEEEEDDVDVEDAPDDNSAGPP